MMNAVIEAAKAITSEQTRQLILGLEYIPADKRVQQMGSCARAPLAIFLECASTMRMAAKLLRNQPADWAAEMPAMEDYPTLEAAKALIEQTQAEFFAALDESADRDMNETVDPGWGHPFTLAEFMMLPSYHSAYHNGQLNYIQCLLGDKEMHF